MGEDESGDSWQWGDDHPGDDSDEDTPDDEEPEGFDLSELDDDENRGGDDEQTERPLPNRSTVVGNDDTDADERTGESAPSGEAESFSEEEPIRGDEPLGGLARRIQDRQSESRTHAEGDEDTQGPHGPGLGGLGSDDGDSVRDDDAVAREAVAADQTGTPAPEGEREEPDPDELLGDLARRVHDRQSESDEDADALFEEMDTAEVDTDELWERVTEEDDLEESAVGNGEATRVEREDPEAMRPDHIVSKSDYCESCQFFSAPPTVACTYEDSEIVEVVDSEQFRVRGCPMIEGVAAFGTVRGRGGSALEGTDDSADSVLE